MITGHHMRNQNNINWFIPLASTTGDELRYSDASMINQKHGCHVGLKSGRFPYIILSMATFLIRCTRPVEWKGWIPLWVG